MPLTDQWRSAEELNLLTRREEDQLNPMLEKAGFGHPYFDFLPRVVILGIQYFKGEDI
jgi:hypothetical protein